DGSAAVSGLLRARISPGSGAECGEVSRPARSAVNEPQTSPASPSPESLEAALAPGSAAPVGRYLLELSSGRWTWSDEVFVMHGFRPGEIVPTTELMLSHKHPDDRARV